jgi:ABC-type lipoprotein export system ATPase subunit
MALFKRFHREQGLTSVLVTHNETIASDCDRVLHMEDGLLK